MVRNSTRAEKEGVENDYFNACTFHHETSTLVTCQLAKLIINAEFFSSCYVTIKTIKVALENYFESFGIASIYSSKVLLP